MPRELITDWKRVGQSGHTADGRKIKASWLNEMAETYDPKQYTALIWWEHRRFLGNLGKVVELKTQEQDSEVVLLAKIAPNSKLIELNDSDQKLFSSMEISPNFAKSGKHYLSGLAATDQPASLGTDELRFSQKEQGNLFSAVIETNFSISESQDDSRLLKKIASVFGLSPKPQIQDNSTMTPEMFKEMQSFFSAQTEAITALANEVKQQFSDGDNVDDKNESNSNQETVELSKIEKTLQEMKNAFTTLSEKVDQATKEQKSTSTPEGTGDASTEDCL